MDLERQLMVRLFSLVLLMLQGSTHLLADDWPQWQGPQRNGNSHEAVAEWTEPPTGLTISLGVGESG